MSFDLSIMSRISKLVLPVNNEHQLYPAMIDLLEGIDVEISTDNMHNVIVHKKGEGKKIAVTTVADCNGMLLRYIDKNIGYLYAEYPNNDDLAGREIEFTDGFRCKIEKNEKEKLIVKLPEDADLMVSNSGQFVKNISYDAEGLVMAGAEIDNIINIYTMVQIIKNVKSDNDLYFVFTTQNRTTWCSDGGKVVAIGKVKPEMCIWFDTVNREEENIVFELGNPRYRVNPKLKCMVDEAAKNAKTEVEDRINVLKASIFYAIPRVIELTGTETIGLAIPAGGTLDGQVVKEKVVKDMVSLICELVD